MPRQGANKMGLAQRRAAAKKAMRTRAALKAARELLAPNVSRGVKLARMISRQHATVIATRANADSDRLPRRENATPEEISAFLKRRGLKAIPRVEIGGEPPSRLIGSTILRYPTGYMPKAGR